MCSGCGPVAARPIPEMDPKTGQKLTTIDFWPPGCLSKNDPFSDPFKIDPGGWQSRPLPALGGQWLHFSFFWGPFWEPFCIIFFILFQTPQNLDFALPYCTFASFKHPKSSHFGTPFRSLFRPHFGTPLWRAFWRTLAPRGAERASPCRFWSILGNRLGSKMAP